MKDDRCDRCYEGTLHHQTISETILKHGRVLTIENIPAEVCARCRYRYLEVKVLRAIDALFDEYAVSIDAPKIAFRQCDTLEPAVV